MSYMARRTGLVVCVTAEAICLAAEIVCVTVETVCVAAEFVYVTAKLVCVAAKQFVWLQS